MPFAVMRPRRPRHADDTTAKVPLSFSLSVFLSLDTPLSLVLFRALYASLVRGLFAVMSVPS
jgi:hypothetical protein